MAKPVVHGPADSTRASVDLVLGGGWARVRPGGARTRPQPG